MLTVDTPVVGDEVRRGRPGRLGRRRPRRCSGSTSTRATTTAPGAEKATDLGPHDLGLAGRADRPAGRGQGRAARPTTPAAASRPAPRAVWVSNHGGRQLDRAASTASAPGRRWWPRSRVRGRGLRRRRESAAGSTCWPPWRSVPTRCFLGRLPALGAGGGRGRRGPDARATSATRSTEAFRLAGCRSVADTRGIAVPPEHPRLGDRAREPSSAAPHRQESRRWAQGRARRARARRGAPRRAAPKSSSGRPQRGGQDRRQPDRRTRPRARRSGPRTSRSTTARTCPRASPAPSSTGR